LINFKVAAKHFMHEKDKTANTISRQRKMSEKYQTNGTEGAKTWSDFQATFQNTSIC